MSRRLRLRDLVKWWIIDYIENLTFRLTSWLPKIDPAELQEIDLAELQKVARIEPYIKSMVHVIAIADILISKGFRVIYGNLSWLEFRGGRHGGWPDLIIGKNGKIGLVEVKGSMDRDEAINRIVGKEQRLRTNFFKGANYISLAKDLGAHLFLAYKDRQYDDYRFIPVLIIWGEITYGSLTTVCDAVEENRVDLEELKRVPALSIDEVVELFEKRKEKA